LRPAHVSSLKSAASRHPVFILVAGHCLVMTLTSGVHHIPGIPLPNLDALKLKALVRLVQVAVHRLPISRSMIIELLGEDERGTRPFQQDQLGSSDDVFRLVLKKLWDELVKPVIKFLDIKVSSRTIGSSEICGPYKKDCRNLWNRAKCPYCNGVISLFFPSTQLATITTTSKLSSNAPLITSFLRTHQPLARYFLTHQFPPSQPIPSK
jgi:hypothetical protein